MSNTSIQNKSRSIDEMLVSVSSRKNFVERTELEGMIDELVASVSEEQQQNLREAGYDLLAGAADAADLVVGVSRAVDVLLDLRNSGLI